MGVAEKSFRIGCGRYLQEPHLIKKCGAEISRFSNKVLVVGGKTALSITKANIQESLSNAKLKYEIIEHIGSCNKEDAEIIAEKAKKEGFGVIVGVGGGVIMDFAKLIANFAKLPIVNIPTSTATCAAYTPLSVCYTRDGRTTGTVHFEKEVDSVLVDTAIITAQPTRLFLSGVFDALAKFVEIKQRIATVKGSLGLDWAYIMAESSFNKLMANVNGVLEDMKQNNISEIIEQTTFITVAITGVISGIARGSNQCALAHKFYETARKLYNKECRNYLHGEMVGVGLLLQNHFNGEQDQNQELLSLMKENNMPYNVEGIGVAATKQTMKEFYDAICSSSAIDKNNLEQCKKFKISFEYFWAL